MILPGLQPSRRPRPEARWTGRAAAARTSAADPNTCSDDSALVTAVYSISRVPRGDPTGGSRTVTESNCDPWLRWTVIAYIVTTSPNRPSGTRFGSPPVAK